ncbi:unnamed protein product [Gordionus sp. m RMFG-2023]
MVRNSVINNEIEQASNPTNNRRESIKLINSSLLNWTIGLYSGHGKYLTAENFGYKLNVTGIVLKKKQYWTLIPELIEDTFSKILVNNVDAPIVYLKSMMDRYLTIDRFGNVSCEADTADEEQRFALVFYLDSHKDDSWKADRWGPYLLLNVKHNYYLSANAKNNTLKGLNKPVDPSEYWSLHLQVHPPYINLKHIHRQKYAKTFCPESVCLSDVIPWGLESLFTLERVSQDRCDSNIINGSDKVDNIFNPTMYTIKTFNGNYLTSNGKSIPADIKKIQSQALFFLIYVQGYLAFRDKDGKYLTAIGNEGAIKCKKSILSKEELWTVTGSSPQINFKGSNDKFVSAQRSIDIVVNQDEMSELETFQLENDSTGKFWRFKTVSDKYWSVGDNACVKCVDDNTNSDKDKFDITWLPNKQLGIKSISNNKYLTLKINKQLFATANDIGEREKFKLYLVNRPFLVLQGTEGYVGEGKAIEGHLDTTKILYEETFIEQLTHESYHFKTKNGLYWTLQDESQQIMALPKSKIKDGRPHTFFIIFKESSKIIIMAQNNNFIKIGAGKKLEATEQNQQNASIWNI